MPQFLMMRGAIPIQTRAALIIQCSMCMPKPPKPQSIPERQVVKTPDNGATSMKTDEDARRRRAMMATAYKGSLGLGAPSTTNVTGA